VPVGCSVTLDDVKPVNELAYIIGIGVLVSKDLQPPALLTLCPREVSPS
jgi:hypothetical protein